MIYTLSLYILVKEIYYLETKESLKSIILIIIYSREQVNLVEKILTLALVLSIISLDSLLRLLINLISTYRNLITNYN